MKESNQQHISKLAQNSIWAGAGGYLNFFFLPLSSLLTTRMLGAQDYGIYSLVQGWINILAGLCTVGIVGANLRLIPIYFGRTENNKIKGSILLTLTTVSLISLIAVISINLFPEAIANLIGRKNEENLKLDTVIIAAFQFYAVSILLTNIYQTFNSSLNGLQLIKYRVIGTDIAGPLIKLVSLALFLFFGFEVMGALSANLLQDLTICLLSLFFLIKKNPWLRDFSEKPHIEYSKISKFSGALFLDSILNKYTFQLDVVLLGYFGFLPVLGLYSVAQNLLRLVYMPSYSIIQIFGPMCGQLYSQNKMQELASLYKVATKWTITMSIPICAFIIYFAQSILSLFGREFSGGVTVAIIIGAGNLIADYLGMAGTLILATGRAYLNFMNSIIVAVINIALYYFFIPKYGIIGAAIAHSFSVLLINIIRVSQVWILYQIAPFSRNQTKPLVACLGALITVIIIDSFYLHDYSFFSVLIFLAIMGMVYGCMYILILRFLGFDSADQLIIDKLKAKFFKLKKR
ncbi:oligosaccharide flippase family protein [bacterium]|nr:oligosaccharide flippase family protein [bacterium]